MIQRRKSPWVVRWFYLEDRGAGALSILTLVHPFHLFPLFAKTCHPGLFHKTSTNHEACSVVSVIAVELSSKRMLPMWQSSKSLCCNQYHALALQPVNRLLHHSPPGSWNVFLVVKTRFARGNFQFTYASLYRCSDRLSFFAAMAFRGSGRSFFVKDDVSGLACYT